MAGKNQAGEEDEDEKGKDNAVEEYDTSSDPVIIDAFASMKSAILSKRTDIVRQIICAAESIREEDYDSDDEDEPDKKVIRDKYDSDEYIDMLSLLLRHKDTDSGTLLHIATRVGSADIVRTLLAAGANCLIKNHEQKNPYHYCSSDLVKSAYVGELMQAISQLRLFRIDHLLKAGIEVNSCDSQTSLNSVLHWGVCFGGLPAVSLLIKRGGEINVRNAHGATPLHDAVNRGDSNIVEELLKNGADANMYAISGPYKDKTPMDLALNNPSLKQLILMYAHENKCNGDVNGSFPVVNGNMNNKGSPVVTDYNGNIAGKKPSAPCGTPTGKLPYMYPVPVNVDPTVNYLCPSPQKVRQFRGLYFVPPEEMTVYIKSSQDDVFEMTDIIELFINKFQKIGIKLSCEYLAQDLDIPSKSSHVECIINRSCFSHQEEYKIQINTHKVFIIASCLASLFYGLSTFLQCLKLFRGKAVPLLQVSDWPKCNKRSIVLDFNQNDIPKLSILLETIDLLSMFKINQIQFNVEHFCNNNKIAFYTRSETLRLQVYCKKRFVALVPYIRIDHGSPLLRSTGNNGVPELCVDSLLQRINIFPSLRAIHVEMILVENRKVIQQITNFCNTNGYTFQVTSKEIDIQFDQMPNLLNGVVCTIDASPTNEWKDHVTSVNEFGLQYIVCYDCSNVKRIYPDIEELASHVYDIFSQPPLCNCYGLSIKYSFQSKRLSTFFTFLPSLIISSSMLWNLTEYMKNDIFILNVINYLVYEDDEDFLGSMFIEMGKSLPLISEDVHSIFDDAHYNKSLFDGMVEGCPIDFSLLNSSSLQKICKTIKVMKQKALLSKVESPLSGPLHQETSILLNLIIVLARICYRLIGLHSKMEKPDLQGLPEVNKSDESNRLMSVIQEFESYSTTYYKSSTNGSTTLGLVSDLLKKIMPKDNRSSGYRSHGGVIDI